MAIYPCPIPKITAVLGAHHKWTQPSNSEIKFTTDGYAVVTAAGLECLQLLTQPPMGMYQGRMWKQQEGDNLYLCWYQDASDSPGKCEIKYRKILPKQALDLLNPGGIGNI